MGKFSRIFKSEERQRKDSQDKLNKILPEYQRKLDALGQEFGVILTASLDYSPMGIFPKVKIILAEDIPQQAPPSSSPQRGVPPIQVRREVK